MKVELLIKKDAPLSEEARAVLEELREELGLEVEVIDAEADSFLYLRHRYDLPVIKLDGRILSQRTADRDEIARRLRHARRMKESQGIEGRLAAGQDGRRVVKVSIEDLGAAPRPAPPPYASPPREIHGDRKVVRVSLSDVAEQAFPKAAPGAAPDKEPAAQPAEKLPPLSLPAPGGEVFFVDGFAGPGLRRKLEAIPGIEELRFARVSGAVGLRGERDAILSAIQQHGGQATPSSPFFALGLSACAFLLGIGAWLAQAGPLALALAATALLLPLALREGRWLLRDLPLVGAHPLAAGGAILAAGSNELSPAWAAGPAAVHLLGLSALLIARHWARAALVEGEAEEIQQGRLIVDEGAAFPADGRLLESCIVDESPLHGEEEVERLAGEEVFAGSIALARTEIEVLPGPERRRLGMRRLQRALAELDANGSTGFLAFSPLLAIAAAGALWAFRGPGAGALVLGAYPSLAIAFFLPLLRATALLRAFVDGVAVATWRAIARAGETRTVVFGKHSLLERGVPAVLGVRPRSLEAIRLLELAAAAESGVDHPIARSIRAHAQELGVSIPNLTRPPTHEAGGVEAEIDGEIVRLGTPSYLGKKGVDTTVVHGLVQEMGQRGSTPVLAALGNEVAGVIEIGAFPSEGARQAIASLELHEVGLVIATSDHDLRAKWLAQALGLEASQAAGHLSSEGEDDLLRRLPRPILLAGGRRHLERSDEADLPIRADGASDEFPAFLLRPDARGVASLVRTGRVMRRARTIGVAALLAQSAAILILALADLLAPLGALTLASLATALSLGAALAPGISLGARPELQGGLGKATGQGGV